MLAVVADEWQHVAGRSDRLRRQYLGRSPRRAVDRGLRKGDIGGAYLTTTILNV
jgi:hypothetical protein